MYLASLVLFVIAIFLPFTSVTKLWVFDNQISVIRGLIILWHSDEIFLFLILFVFTVAFPFVKINTMLVLWLNDENMSLCTPDPLYGSPPNTRTTRPASLTTAIGITIPPLDAGPPKIRSGKWAV